MPVCYLQSAKIAFCYADVVGTSDGPDATGFTPSGVEEREHPVSAAVESEEPR